MKRIILSFSVLFLLISNLQAMDKESSYKIINQCKANIKDGGKNDTLVMGFLIGLSVAFQFTLQEKGIDNEYASLTSTEYGDLMCKWALNIRKIENKKTGGKYDVTTFSYFLKHIGYRMTLIDSNQTK